jgi:hypothetical protein
LTIGFLVIIAIRLIVPLSIFRYPLAGGIASMVVDALDVVIIELIGLGGFEGHYHTTDKLLDTYYLAIEWVVAFRWESPWARWPALVLFPYRIIGVVLFEVTGQRVMLFIFPNMFENWWLYCVFVARFIPSIYPRSFKATVIPLALLLIPKMAQEYLLHYREAQPWDWIKRNILGTD